MNIVETLRDLTRQDLQTKLKKYGKCALIRCTGFGKTWMLADIIQNYKKVLYLYPAEVIKSTVKDRIGDNSEEIETASVIEIRQIGLTNLHFMSYMKLIRMSLDEIAKESYDLIIFDECHRLGGLKTKRIVQEMVRNLTGVHFIGATATPDRMDSYDIIEDIFCGITTYEYTLHDAFKDGIIKKPYYCYCTYNMDAISDDLRQGALTAGEDIDDLSVQEVLKSKLIEISKIYNMHSIIKSVCDKYAPGTDCMKFIVFFSSVKQMKEKGDDVSSWFQNAYPDHKIKILTITSHKREFAENVKKLDQLTYKPQTIYLIFCIDMLNMGYHVSDMTGLLMYRGTSSSIVYNQQLGRALSTGKTEPCIVFDVVDNLHRKAAYTLIPTKDVCPKRKTKRLSEKLFRQLQIAMEAGNQEEIARINAELLVALEKESSNSWYKHCNYIEETDLIATGHEATYRELIAKAVAEPYSQRCKETVEAHFHRWCRNNGVEYPITSEDMKIIYSLDKKDFTEHFKKIVQAKHLDYPIDDKKLLLKIGNGNEDDGVPLEVFARWKNVSIAAVLNLLGLDDSS